MLYIGFALRNPWLQGYQVLANKVIAVSQHKTIEIALYKNNCIFECSFSVTGFRQNHAGFSFDFGLFGYDFDFMFYDNRHYDERTNNFGVNK